MTKRVGYEFLGKNVEVIIDRPLGSKHPKWNFEYKVNYGYVKEVIAEDGKELDAYVLGIDKPLNSFEGICIALIFRVNDIENKLIVAPKGIYFSDEEILKEIEFQEKFFESYIIRKNE